MTSLKQQVLALDRDVSRERDGFSSDISTCHKVLLNPYSTVAEREKALLLWLRSKQPCVFGRIAASRGLLHVAIITDEFIQRSTDAEVGAFIADEVREWRRRSLNPTRFHTQAAHGFLLLVCGPRLAYAKADSRLEAFAERILRTWRCPTEASNAAVHYEQLYLQNPTTRDYYRFTAFVDFFAVQGDGTWWHDHRVPGGIMFTVNSAGHMARYREWYESANDSQRWLLANAMQTIGLAAETKWGKATRLRSMPAGVEPVVSGSDAIRKELPAALANFDVTRYEGFFNTDHSVRPEFFAGMDPTRIAEITRKYWLLDFTYLHHSRSQDHLRLIHGERCGEEEVFGKLGGPDTWEQAVTPSSMRPSLAGPDDMKGITVLGPGSDTASPEQAMARGQIDDALNEMSRWE